MFIIRRVGYGVVIVSLASFKYYFIKVHENWVQHLSNNIWITITNGNIMLMSGILRDKTMEERLVFIRNDDKQNQLFFKTNYVLKLKKYPINVI